MPKIKTEGLTNPKAIRSTRRAMTVLLRDVPPSYNWGWFSREEPRMHLQVVDKVHGFLHYKVWLENKTRRAIQPVGSIPPKIFKVLQSEISKQRERIETYWIIFMIKNGWLKVRLKNGILTILAYPHTPNHFERTLPLAEIIPNEEIARKVTPQDVTLNEEFGLLEIFPQKEEAARDHVPLGDILWGG